MTGDAFPEGAHDFSQPDFPGPVGRAGRGQVHKVDAGDEEDEQGDRREGVDILDRLVVPAEAEVSVQVDVDERHQHKLSAAVVVEPLPGCRIALNLLPSFRIRPQALECPVPDQPRDFLVCGLDRAFLVELDKRQDVIAAPAVIILPERLDEVEGDQHIENERRVGRDIFRDSGHCKRICIIDRDSLANRILAAEIFSCHVLRDDQGAGPAQRRLGVSADKWEGEYPE